MNIEEYLSSNDSTLVRIGFQLLKQNDEYNLEEKKYILANHRINQMIMKPSIPGSDIKQYDWYKKFTPAEPTLILGQL